MNRDDPNYFPDNLETYIAGDDCKCGAYNRGECGCGVDWTPKEIYILRKENQELKIKLEQAHTTIEWWKNQYYNKAK